MIGVEICIAGDDAETVRRAAASAGEGGASAIEVCHAMHLDGLTPPTAHVRAARDGFGSQPGLRVMVRPHGNDFFCDTAQERLMTAQIQAGADAGADGVVLGVLRRSDQRVDEPVLRRLIGKADSCGLDVTFHRAFDAVSDTEEALETLIGLGVARILTSGRPWGCSGTALDGLPGLRRTIAQAAGRIEIIVGGGVTADNLPGLLTELPHDLGPISVHAYSGAQIGGVTTADAVRRLVRAAQAE